MHHHKRMRTTLILALALAIALASVNFAAAQVSWGDVPANAGGACSCVVNIDYTAGEAVFTGLCTKHATFEDPFEDDYACWCGKNVPCKVNANATVHKAPIAAGINYCNDVVNATDITEFNNYYSSTCSIPRPIGVIDNCVFGEANNHVSVVTNKAKNFTAGQQCALITKRHLCDVCNFNNDTDAGATWRIEDASTVCQCNILDTASAPCIRYEAACTVEGGPPVHAGWNKCPPCGPLVVPCVNDTGTNVTEFTRIYVSRDIDDREYNPGCKNFEEWDYYCWDGEDFDIFIDNNNGCPYQDDWETLACGSANATKWDNAHTVNDDTCTITTVTHQISGATTEECFGQSGYPCKVSTGVSTACTAASCGGITSHLKHVRRPALNAQSSGAKGAACPEGLYTWQHCNTVCSDNCVPTVTGDKPAGKWSDWTKCESLGAVECSSDPQDTPYGIRSRYRNLENYNDTATCSVDIQSEFQSCYPHGCEKRTYGEYAKQSVTGLLSTFAVGAVALNAFFIPISL